MNWGEVRKPEEGVGGGVGFTGKVWNRPHGEHE